MSTRIGMSDESARQDAQAVTAPVDGIAAGDVAPKGKSQQLPQPPRPQVTNIECILHSVDQQQIGDRPQRDMSYEKIERIEIEKHVERPGAEQAGDNGAVKRLDQKRQRSLGLSD